MLTAALASIHLRVVPIYLFQLLWLELYFGPIDLTSDHSTGHQLKDLLRQKPLDLSSGFYNTSQIQQLLSCKFDKITVPRVNQFISGCTWSVNDLNIKSGDIFFIQDSIIEEGDEVSCRCHCHSYLFNTGYVTVGIEHREFIVASSQIGQCVSRNLAWLKPR